MELKAKLVELLPVQSGVGKTGNAWKKQDIVVETDGQYPKKVCISVWGDKADESILQLGNELNISFDVESREYNGRWYTDIKAWKIELASATTPSSGTTGVPPTMEIPAPTHILNDDDGLPF